MKLNKTKSLCKAAGRAIIYYELRKTDAG